MIDLFPQYRTKLDRLAELLGEPVYLRLDKNTGAGSVGTAYKGDGVQEVGCVFAPAGARQPIDGILDDFIDLAEKPVQKEQFDWIEGDICQWPRAEAKPNETILERCDRLRSYAHDEDPVRRRIEEAQTTMDRKWKGAA